MKPNPYAFMIILLVAIAALYTGCAIPGKMWPRSDITPSRVGSATSEQTVLLASNSSEFKEILVENIIRAVTAENMAVDIVGIEGLSAIESEEYAAVVIISTCLAWSVDPLVRKFIDRRPDHDRIVLVITSDSGWLPKKTDLDIDAMTSASVLADSDAVSRQIMTRLHQMLDNAGS
jgi:hypothetical protein